MAVADELARLIALKDAGHLSGEEFQAAKAAVLGQTRIDHAPPPERPTAVIPAPPLGDEALQTATFSAPTRRSRRPLLVALATLSILLAAGVAFVVTGSKNQVASGGPSPNSAATESPVSPVPSTTTAASANTVQLDMQRLVGRAAGLRAVTVPGAIDVPLGVLAFHDARVRAEPAAR